VITADEIKNTILAQLKTRGVSLVACLEGDVIDVDHEAKVIANNIMQVILVTQHDRMRDALSVLVRSPKIRAWLMANDPKAYEQAWAALDVADVLAKVRS
jgi:hypothetical protein